MTSQCIQLGSYVRERRKTEPLSVYGKIDMEIGSKVWSVRFFNKEKAKERKSAQLAFVDLLELPQEVASYFGAKPTSSGALQSRDTPLSRTTHDKENNKRLTITGTRFPP